MHLYQTLYYGGFLLMLVQRAERLTKVEELELGYKIRCMMDLRKAGFTGVNEYESIFTEGEEAVEELSSNYYNLVRNIAYKLHRRTGTRCLVEDLIQDGIYGLLKSTYKYDISKNCTLGTYAYYGITKEISTSINYHRLIRMPENKMSEYNEILKVKANYKLLNDEEKMLYPTKMDYIYSSTSDIGEEEVDLIIGNMQPSLSLNTDGNDKRKDELITSIEDKDSENQFRNLEVLSDLEVVLNGLSEYDKNLISYEFGIVKPTIPYEEFKVKYKLTDRQINYRIKDVIVRAREVASNLNLGGVNDG